MTQFCFNQVCKIDKDFLFRLRKLDLALEQRFESTTETSYKMFLWFSNKTPQDFGRINFGSEAAVRRYSSKQVFLKIAQNSQESTCARASFLIEVCNFIKKEALAQVFFCEFANFLITPFVNRAPLWTEKYYCISFRQNFNLPDSVSANLIISCLLKT